MSYARKGRAVVVFLATTAIALVAVSAVLAAGPAEKDRFRFTDVEADFCGTGKDVVVEGRGVYNAWIGETGGDTQVVRSKLNLTVTLTNQENGASVVERWSHMSTNEIVIGQESGPHTHLFVENGLKAMLKLGRGGVLTRDAGSLRILVSFDEDDNVTGLEFVARGPHPFYPDGDFCGIVSAALGL